MGKNTKTKGATSVEQLKEEADCIRDLIKNMPKNIKPGSQWFIVSMTWINRWQAYVGFDDGSQPQPAKHPGQMDNTDIIINYYKTKDDKILSVSLAEMGNNDQHMNYQLTRGMKEGEDFMLVDDNIHTLWHDRYGEVQTLKRFGIVDENGENSVELYFKQVQILPVPNQKLFKFYKGSNAESQQLYISKTATVKDLEKKVLRTLMAYLYFTQKNKSINLTKVRLWKALDEIQKLGEIEKKWMNFTQAKINAECLNVSEDQKNKMLYEIDLADSDIVIVEIPKDNDFVFVPQSQSADEEEKN